MIGWLEYLVKFYRIPEWIYVPGLSIFGFLYVVDIPLDTLPLASCLLLSSFYLAFGYSSNSLFENYMGKKKPIRLVAPSFLPGLMALLIAYLISNGLLLLMLIGIFLSIVYSAPPLMIKGRPVLDLLANSGLFTIVFLTGVMTGGGSLTSDVLIISLFIFVMVIPFQLIHELVHMPEDSSKGFRTTALSTNLQNVKSVIIVSSLVAMLISALTSLKFQLPLTFTILTSIFCISIVVWVKPLRAGDHTRYKILRSKLRILSIVYGFLLLFIFVLFQH